MLYCLDAPTFVFDTEQWWRNAILNKTVVARSLMACTITFKQEKWTFKLIDTNKVKDYSQDTSPNLNAGYAITLRHHILFLLNI